MISPSVIKRRQALQYIASALVLPTFGALAQSDYPSKPIKFIIPLPAGGAADVGVRAMGQELEKSIKQSVVVDNKPGGLFQIGMQALLSAPADGYTVLAVNAGMVGVQVVNKRYDLNKQTMPLLTSGEAPMVLMVGAKTPFKTLQELIDYAKANPGKLNYATPGLGSIEHLKNEQIAKVAGFKATNVAYKGGPDMVKAVVGGEVDYTIAPAVLAAQFAPKGLVRVLAAIDSERIKAFADVPTLIEVGIKVSPMRLWGGYVVHPDTPAAIAQRLSRELVTALSAPAYVEKMAQFGLVTNISKSPEDFRKLIDADAAWMTEAAKDLNLQPQ